jgi:NAD(P)H-flavin reductase
MFTIVKKETFSPTTFVWQVEAPDIAEAAQAGQFVIVRLKNGGERIPLTIADFDRDKGHITLVVKVVGKTTEEMDSYKEGEQFQDLIGPLGNPTKIEKKDHVVLIGGGLGVAPIYPILRAFKQAGCQTTAIIGFREEGEIFWNDRFSEFSDRLIIMTDDGSFGKKGTVVDGLKEVVEGPERAQGIDEVLAIGPIVMMQAVAEYTRPFKIHTMASMNSIMVDGIGMCGSCRVTVDGKVLFACVDGPDMDAHKINFEELKVRQMRFANEEQATLRKYHEECALGKRGIDT